MILSELRHSLAIVWDKKYRRSFSSSKELINKNREWREELLKNTSRDFIEKTVGDMLFLSFSTFVCHLMGKVRNIFAISVGKYTNSAIELISA